MKPSRTESGSKSTTSENDRLRVSRTRLFLLCLAGSLLLYAAFPPLNLWPLAWLAPVFWIAIVRLKTLPQFSYRTIYAASLVHWLLLMYGVGNAHWATRCFGWPALSGYLAVYLPLFVLFSRVAVHRWKLPVTVSAPLVWVGLELFRGYMATGFSMALLGHTQVTWLSLIQISDLVGAYGVSFVLMVAAAALVELNLFDRFLSADIRLINQATKRTRTISAICAGLVLLATLGYGQFRLSEKLIGTKPPISIAIIQGSIDTEFGDKTQSERTINQYIQLTDHAVSNGQKYDLILWPETTTGDINWWEASENATSPENYDRGTDEEFRALIKDNQKYFVATVNYWATQRWQTPLLLGTSARRYERGHEKIFNSAIFIDQQGRIAERYDKMHPVLFGEYVPLGDWFPWLYKVMPIPTGLSSGTAPKTIEINSVKLSPCICFENTVPHLIRRQINTLASSGNSPDVLVTLSNDGWFWGSSILDLHLTCGVFRAVENRLPMVIAANTGFSALIDSSGQIVNQGPRQATAVIPVTVDPVERTSWYLASGDWFAGICLLFSGAACLQLIYDWRRSTAN
ncbi:MAG: apolipoprotein N-acyltransferase [Blastopirellula sp.]|nr:MAG: apolipoprotein N-acyltransferase [Blastopirellula sp.]